MQGELNITCWAHGGRGFTGGGGQASGRRHCAAGRWRSNRGRDRRGGARRDSDTCRYDNRLTSAPISYMTSVLVKSEGDRSLMVLGHAWDGQTL